MKFRISLSALARSMPAVAAILASLACGVRAVGQEAPEPSVQELMAKRLSDLGGRQLAVTKLVYPPGASEVPPHRHQAYLAIYVVSGHVESAVDDQEPVVYGPGDVWYESHLQLHRTFRNASDTEPFTVIVFAIRDADHPANVAASGADGD